MPQAYLTRRVTFAAAHRYHRPEWSDARNEEVFGSCSRDSYHGHNYVCEVTLRGEIDDVTGFIIGLDTLDSILDEEVKARFDNRNINVDVAEFADGKLMPSGENLARFIFGRLRLRLPEGVQLTDVTIAEDQTLSASYKGE